MWNIITEKWRVEERITCSSGRGWNIKKMMKTRKLKKYTVSVSYVRWKKPYNIWITNSELVNKINKTWSVNKKLHSSRVSSTEYQELGAKRAHITSTTWLPRDTANRKNLYHLPHSVYFSVHCVEGIGWDVYNMYSVHGKLITIDRK